MIDAFICDPIRTPIGRYGGALATVRADDLAAVPIAALLERNANLDPVQIEDLAYGCANQAGEDNRNVARMAVLLSGLPVTVPAVTVNRLCGSGMNAIGKILKRYDIPLPRLADYEIRIPRGGSTNALTEATITWENKQATFKTRGVHSNQVFAAMNATIRMLNLQMHRLESFRK